MAKRKKSYNDSMGQSRERKTGKGMESEEADEAEDYGRNINVMRGHQQDSRFDEGSTHTLSEMGSKGKIVRPSTGGYAKSQFHRYMKGK